MKKLALIGKNIQHSRSPEIYRRLISKDIHYDLLDCQTPQEIPSLKDLFLKYEGINITSPYKQHFLSDIKLTNNAKELLAVNCLKKRGEDIWGENTDYLAIVDILKKMEREKYHELNVILLGDGVMSRVTQQALSHLKIDFRIFSRKLTDGFYQLNLPEIFARDFKSLGQQLVINTCARDYVFNGSIDKKTIFWDYNYNFDQHLSILPERCFEYIDGLEVLELQALHAVSFWSV